MADNYLENRYEEYLERKRKKEAEQRAAFRKRLEKYRRRASDKSSHSNPTEPAQETQ